MRFVARRVLSVAIFMLTMYGGRTQAVLVTIPFNTPGSVAAQTAPFGISTFVSNSFATTIGISALFTGNVAAPVGPPSALSLGASAGPTTYFHFSPLTGYLIHSIGISATGGFTDQSTTFHVFAANSNGDVLDYDAPMIPTAAGIAGLNGGAIFLSAASPVFPIIAFRVWQLDDGFGILDNLVADVTVVPEARQWLMMSVVALGAIGVGAFRRRRVA